MEDVCYLSILKTIEECIMLGNWKQIFLEQGMAANTGPAEDFLKKKWSGELSSPVSWRPEAGERPLVSTTLFQFLLSRGDTGWLKSL